MFFFSFMRFLTVENLTREKLASAHLHVRHPSSEKFWIHYSYPTKFLARPTTFLKLVSEYYTSFTVYEFTFVVQLLTGPKCRRFDHDMALFILTNTDTSIKVVTMDLSGNDLCKQCVSDPFSRSPENI